MMPKSQYIFYDRDDTRIKYLSAYTAPGTQVEYWDVAHVLTDENRITPHPVADEFTATLVTNQCMDTSIEIPETGWIELYGSVAGDAESFSIRLPVAKLLAVTAAAATNNLQGGSTGLQFSVGEIPSLLSVRLRTGNLLFEGPAGTASLTVSN